jgi:hypothetical protein
MNQKLQKRQNEIKSFEATDSNERVVGSTRGFL